MAEKPKAKKKVEGQYQIYETTGGNLKRKNRNCPKCGPSYFLAKHANRETCGKCGYTEFGGKK